MSQQQEAGYAPPFWDIIRVGNVGTTVIVSLVQVDPNTNLPVAVDLTNNSELQIDIRKPSGKVLEFTAQVLGVATDGQMIRNDNIGIFDVRGRYACRGVVTFTSGNTFKGSWVGFPVDD